ncbi:hypothetical protein BABINDRAFT_159652 [Babjeviella inositovora NRRL Y-12698]|uniref:Glutamyl-tRNA(Gln) amidotransferase subunit B, mitochondrial n=1 Tax=Babjeviella inositovora NRRL Y-12698 TaxID=984486 RepID=A0A1E3R004_9ASCO|nr:uncharacterized protein BABINDRAFT_159652 [Babjeviella inositovora NRRL Y-12698]ODQ83211.1 hypothetical protein BABINDRAFT_159652 [Babjeviella inositovora NRRL Y-12698]
MLRRAFSTTPVRCFELLDNYTLKCGLEIHTQLDTKHKLFSLSSHTFNAEPNTRTSFFDCALPGAQPRLNPEALLFALKAATALNSTVNLESTFDRKHYFYGDQPHGYQITQHYNPLAKGGSITLLPHDGVKSEKIIHIDQIQIEQDTGKSSYVDHNQTSKVDLNRANVPLIEVVTQPDFRNVDEVRAFIRKYQTLVRHLGISTGELESGAMRVDVNISVNDGSRIEMKNLSTTSAVTNAIRYEYTRQVRLLQSTNTERLTSGNETRGWNGSTTYRLRSKESAIDYRYMPDPELPPVRLQQDIVEQIRAGFPEFPDDIIAKLTAKPFGLRLKDAQVLINNSAYLAYYMAFFEGVVGCGLPGKLATNWFFHDFLGHLHKLEEEGVSHALEQVVPVARFSELVSMVHGDEISKASGKLLLAHMVSHVGETTSLVALVEEYDLGKVSEITPEVANAIAEICAEIIAENPKVVADYQEKKKKNSVKWMIGQAMRLSQGKIDSGLFEESFKRLLGK